LAVVYLDGRNVGTTPFKNSYLSPGPHSLRLVNHDSKEFSRDLELKNNISTVVNWDFSTSDSGSGYLLSLERTGDVKRAGLMVISSPSDLAVAVNGEIKGKTPLSLADIGTGEKQITLSYPGFRSLTVYAISTAAYSLYLEVQLGQLPQNPALVLPTPSLLIPVILIKSTPTGWLNVRQSPSTSAAIIAKIKPGEKYPYLASQSEWYQIKVSSGQVGWIASKYADKLSE
jgi:hypothetical protein